MNIFTYRVWCFVSSKAVMIVLSFALRLFGQLGKCVAMLVSLGHIC